MSRLLWSLWYRCTLQLDKILRLVRHLHVTTKLDVGVSAVICLRQVLSPTVWGDEGVECNSKIETSYKAYLQSHVISNSTNTYRTIPQNSTHRQHRKVRADVLMMGASAHLYYVYQMTRLRNTRSLIVAACFALTLVFIPLYTDTARWQFQNTRGASTYLKYNRRADTKTADFVLTCDRRTGRRTIRIIHIQICNSIYWPINKLNKIQLNILLYFIKCICCLIYLL